MKIRTRDGHWVFSRPQAMHVLRLDGTGALRPHRIKGVLRIERGGVWMSAFHPRPRPR